LNRKPKQVQTRSNFRCPGEGFFRDPNNCGMFYRCTERQRFYFACPEGLYFDEELSTCNWPQQAKPTCEYRR
jgi:hypothetical protein